MTVCTGERWIRLAHCTVRTYGPFPAAAIHRFEGCATEEPTVGTSSPHHILLT
ncbi:hypothetical protein BD309DRAFT_962825 [Dichomitus squalens]|nr:hypothetical protein BD309DRAFT_962825 [Dichomitus squalens]